MINQHKAEPSSSVPPSSKNVDSSITPKPEPLALQPAPPSSGGQEAVVKNIVRGAVVKEESSGNNSTTIGVPSKAVTENVATGKKKMGATGGGSSLANLWGKAPAKVRAITPPESAAKPALITGTFIFCLDFVLHGCRSICSSSSAISVPVRNSTLGCSMPCKYSFCR